VTPHQLRHTLATQAINRGMSLEAIAALLGHKSMRMTMVYAKIASRTVADEYLKVSEKVEALYDAPKELATAEGAEMRKLRAEMHRRMLGNGYCARPVGLDCHFESICESCTYFQTTHEFKPTLASARRRRPEGPGRPIEDLRRAARQTRAAGIMTALMPEPVLFEVATNPEPGSTLPFLIRLPLTTGELVLKARDSWPRTAKGLLPSRRALAPNSRRSSSKCRSVPASDEASRSTWCSTARGRTAPNWCSPASRAGARASSGRPLALPAKPAPGSVSLAASPPDRPN
jgi:Phage integrase family